MTRSPRTPADSTAQCAALAGAVGSVLRCKCCAVGFPLTEDGYHKPTQVLGMIPYTKCTLVRRGDVKRFRDFLNAQDDRIPHRHNRYHQRTRRYGDYLYAQDREKFMVDMREWLLEQEPKDIT